MTNEIEISNVLMSNFKIYFYVENFILLFLGNIYLTFRFCNLALSVKKIRAASCSAFFFVAPEPWPTFFLFT